jgi:opacity protein-like surface antigen
MSKFRLLTFAGFKTDFALLPYMTGRQNLYVLDAGVSGVHVLNPRNQITWSIAAGFSEDDSTVSSPKIKETGRVVAAYRKSDSLTLLYGGGYSFDFGQGRFLPVLGFHWRPHPGTTVSVVGPFSGHVQQRISQRLMVGAQAGVSGNQYHIANNEQFSSPTDNLYLRLKEVRFGGQVGVRLNRSVSLLGDAGVATARTLTYADGKTRLSSLDVGAEPYVSISLRYSFSKQARWEDFGEGSSKK